VRLDCGTAQQLEDTRAVLDAGGAGDADDQPRWMRAHRGELPGWRSIAKRACL
jgi:hypothetical protein